MATTFSSLYSWIRYGLGDIASSQVYSDSQLDVAIRMALAQDADHSEETEDSSKTITPTCTASEKGWLAATAALVFAAPQNVKSYRTPVLSIGRDTRQRIDYLETLQRRFANGGEGIALIGENEVRAYFRGIQRLQNELDEESSYV